MPRLVEHETVSARVDPRVADIEGSTLASIARSEGTPVYVYAASVVRERYLELDRAFGAHPHRIHYALKANSTLALARLIRSLGGCVDANSGGEVEVALKAGFAPDDIVFTGVGKTRAELEMAVHRGLFAINAESQGELERIDQLAQSAGVQARVALRLNPDVAAGAHPHISTGQRVHKFGVPLGDAKVICRWVGEAAGLALVGVHAHIGSQMVTVDPIRQAAAVIADFAREVKAGGAPLEHIDIGGGLGISYEGGDVASAGDYAKAIVDATASTGLSIIVEPGRWIIGPAGVLVTRVVDVKPRGPDRFFVVVDAGMSELVRPALYDAYHRITVLEPRSTPPVACDIVGPICETSDVFGRDRLVPLPLVDDLLVVHDAGAYGASMASNYNRHPLPAEVMVDDGIPQVIRRRQSVDDMLAMEA